VPVEREKVRVSGNNATWHPAKKMSPLSPGRLLLRHNATFGLEKSSSPKVALESQASRNAVSYLPLPAVQSANEERCRRYKALQTDLQCNRMLLNYRPCNCWLRQRLASNLLLL
jgi:hypothetical protein